MYGIEEHEDYINGMDGDSEYYSRGENPDYFGDPEEGEPKYIVAYRAYEKGMVKMGRDPEIMPYAKWVDSYIYI